LIVAVTGSVGKTTTTSMIAAVLAHPAAERVVGKAAATSRNMNNDFGLPLTILRHDRWLSEYVGEKLVALCMLPWRALLLATIADYPRVLVLECAAGPRGHVRRSVRLARPTIGVVTAIGPAHLDRFKTVEGVMREKSAVVSAVPRSGLVVLGEGHDYVAQLAQLSRAPVVRVRGRGAELSRNIARTIGRHLELPENVINAALAQYRPAERRLDRLQLGDLTVIDDSYNANPLSMKLGLDVLADSAAAGQRRVAILGLMAELGDGSPGYHAEIGAYARTRSDFVVGVGDLARHYGPDRWFATSEECAAQIARLLAPGDCVLVKGSASVRMSAVVETLARSAPAAATSVAA
jgi:UDP-N-acetylmuramoyl-tripeptide--D-alanyl-D-alanine ligase